MTRPRTRFVVGLCIMLSLHLMTTPLAYAARVKVHASPTYSNPVMDGDYPDPTIIRVGNDFYVAATSAEWEPVFPILHSTDLVNWTPVGHIFPTRPAWSTEHYWAPELSFWNNKFWCYYSSHVEPNGPQAVAVATADNILGPWTDHGIVVQQSDGSIDAMAITDQQGQRWLIWKEDANSVNKPTWIWAQMLTQNGTALTGKAYQLIRETEAWEGPLVEGPFMLWKDGYYYLFFAGNGCCGLGCKYGTGVARATSIEGPWEKSAKNPILYHNDYIMCPGHGSIVIDQQGRYWFAHHGYPNNNGVPMIFNGRELMVDEVLWGSDGWPVINGGQGSAWNASSPFGAEEAHKEWNTYIDFRTYSSLGEGWMWPTMNQPNVSFWLDGLILTSNTSLGAGNLTGSLAVTSTDPSYLALTNVSVADGSKASLCAWGDPNNTLCVTIDPTGTATMWGLNNDQETVYGTVAFSVDPFYLLSYVTPNSSSYAFTVTNPQGQAHAFDYVDGAYLPPWDRGVRVAIAVSGQPGATATFTTFQIRKVFSN